MASANLRTYRSREARVSSRPGEARNFVRYAVMGAKQKAYPAQFGDVSSTGMRVISRGEAPTRVGDYVDIEFTLPGSHHEFKSRALVVRKIGDFEFAIAFLEFKEGHSRLLQFAIAQYVRYLRTPSLAKFFSRANFWLTENRRGLGIALLGVLFIGGLCTFVYLNSDEHLGRQIRSWAKPYPKQWDWDYYNGTPKN